MKVKPRLKAVALEQSSKHHTSVQVVEVVAGDVPKEQWLMGHIAEFIDRGDVLVFANQKTRVDMLCDKLKAAGIRCASCIALAQHIVSMAFQVLHGLTNTTDIQLCGCKWSWVLCNKPTNPSEHHSSKHCRCK